MYAAPSCWPCSRIHIEKLKSAVLLLWRLSEVLCSLHPLGLVTMATSRQPPRDHAHVWVGSSTVTEEEWVCSSKKEKYSRLWIESDNIKLQLNCTNPMYSMSASIQLDTRLWLTLTNMHGFKSTCMKLGLFYCYRACRYSQSESPTLWLSFVPTSNAFLLLQLSFTV